MTMRIETKSAVILLVTLFLGILIGVLAAGAVAQARMSRIADLRERGIARHIEQIVEPRDDDQREAIRAVLEEIGRRNREIMGEAHQRIRGNLEELRERLEPLLDQEQRQRLEAAAERLRGGPGFGPPGGPGFRPPGRGMGRPGRREWRQGGPGDSAPPPLDSVRSSGDSTSSP